MAKLWKSAKQIQRTLRWPPPPPDDDIVKNQMLDACFRTEDQKYDSNFFLEKPKIAQARYKIDRKNT